MPDTPNVNADVVVPETSIDPILVSAQSLASEAYADEPLAASTQVATTWHVPGTALETVADRDANDVVRAEPVSDPEVPAVLSSVETRDPVANLNSRNNIVPSGFGSVEDSLRLQG